MEGKQNQLLLNIVDIKNSFGWLQKAIFLFFFSCFQGRNNSDKDERESIRDEKAWNKKEIQT